MRAWIVALTALAVAAVVIGNLTAPLFSVIAGAVVVVGMYVWARRAPVLAGPDDVSRRLAQLDGYRRLCSLCGRLLLATTVIVTAGAMSAMFGLQAGFSMQQLGIAAVATSAMAVAAIVLRDFMAARVERLRGWSGAQGHCRKCGYNLKGVSSKRCPECGTVR